MPVIRVLDPNVVGQIAAGEVVERPQSVIKELVENSIDAGAAAVTVEIKNGGIDLMRVTDNGCGIDPRQVLTAFENHATSKLVSAEQLTDIRTLGFRGEALPSIAAVARVELTTRTKGSPVGVKCTIDENGRHVSEAGCPEGTTMVVKDLFYNTPVRRTFLKSANREAAYVKETVMRLILANPQVSIRFISNGKTVYRSYGDGDMRHAAYTVYGQEVARLLKSVDESEGTMRIAGLVGVGELSRPTRGSCMFFINSRVVRCQALQNALENACEGIVPRGSYPMCALSVTLANANVDVNVHPNKLEVRFRDEESVFETARLLLTRALGNESALKTMFEPEKRDVSLVSRVTETGGDQSPTVPESAPKQAKPLESGVAAGTDKKREPYAVGNAEPENGSEQKTGAVKKPAEIFGRPREAADAADKDTSPAKSAGKGEKSEKPAFARPAVDFYSVLEREQKRIGLSAPSEEAHEPRREKAASPADEVHEPKNGSVPAPEKEGPAADLIGDAPAYRVIGTLFRTYILVETKESMVMIDQHAAHERLQYERFKKRLDEGTAAQMLLVPVLVELSPAECEAVRENEEILRETGYVTELFGENCVRVLSVPHIFGRADTKVLFCDLADRLNDIRNQEKEARMEEVMRFSCRRSVRAGDQLSEGEITQLLKMLQDSPIPPTCPHGRPIFRTVTRREIEKQFGRIK